MVLEPLDPADSSGFPNPGSSLFGLEVVGDSLVGDGIVEGDFVFVDPQTPFIDGKLYVVRIEGMVMFKHVYLMDRSRYKLVLGPSEIEVDRSEIEILDRVTGRVREH